MYKPSFLNEILNLPLTPHTNKVNLNKDKNARINKFRTKKYLLEKSEYE